MSGYRFLSLAKRALICALLGLSCAVMVQAYLLLSDMRDLVTVTGIRVNSVASELTDSIYEWRAYTAKLEFQLDDPQVKRGMGLLLRSGDDLARTIKRANVTLENLNDAIRDTSSNLNDRLIPAALLAIDRTASTVNDQTLPDVDRALQSTARAAEAARDAIRDTSSEISASMVGVRKAIEGIEARVNDPRFDSILMNVDAAAGHANASLDAVEKKTKQMIKPVHWIWRGIREAAVVTGRVLIP